MQYPSLAAALLVPVLSLPAEAGAMAAGVLIGQPLEHPGGERTGTIADIEFDAGDSRVEHVVVSTVAGGTAHFPASTLAHGRFPPLTRWHMEHPSLDASGNCGNLRREPSDERNRLHEHRWPRN